MKLEYTHTLSSDEAYARISMLLQKLQDQYADKITNPMMSWNESHTQMDFTLEVKGIKTQGQVFLKDGQISLEGKIPFLARAFSGKIESMIKKKLDDLLA